MAKTTTWLERLQRRIEGPWNRIKRHPVVVILAIVLAGAAGVQRATGVLSSLWTSITAIMGQTSLPTAEREQRLERALAQLADGNSPEVRLGGVESLRRLARDSPADHSRIVETLATWVRERSHRVNEDRYALADSKEPQRDHSMEEVCGDRISPAPEL